MNYKHLHYFMQVAKTGSVLGASERLHVTPQTISGQIQLLEEQLGSPLFGKSGRGLVLTEAGRLALGYAEREARNATRELPAGTGVADGIRLALKQLGR